MPDERLRPVLTGPGASDYERYLRTDELLGLQKGPESWLHRDELLFQVTHQSSELWLKLAAVEIEAATVQVTDGDLAAASRLLRRSVGSLAVVTDQIHMLEHIAPAEYHVLRRALGHGSGFDSPGFRRILEASPPLGAALRARLDAAGLTPLELYRQNRSHEALYTVAELLIEWDERVILWRFHHLKLVERVIGGHAVGTQGTPVEVLEARVPAAFYPWLWAVRDQLTESAEGASAPDGGVRT